MNAIFDLQNLYKSTFGNSPYFIAKNGSETQFTNDVNLSTIAQNPNPKGTIYKGRFDNEFNKISSLGLNIWLPVELKALPKYALEIEACTVAVNLTKNVTVTEVSQRKGTIKEKSDVEDYRFTVKGFLIGKNRTFPGREIETLIKIFESKDQVQLKNGYTDIFLDKNRHVAMYTLEFPPVEGKSSYIRPFLFTCASDFIDELTIL